LSKVGALIGIVILVVVAAVMYPLVNTQVTDLTDEESDNYVGASTAPIVSLIPIFYWLMIALTAIGAAVVGLKDTE
jgi:CDP-diglyceride synthetase